MDGNWQEYDFPSRSEGEQSLLNMLAHPEWKFLKDPGKKDFSKLLDQEKHRKLKRENDLEEEKIAPVSLLTDAPHKAAAQIIPIMESLSLIMKRNWPENNRRSDFPGKKINR